MKKSIFDIRIILVFALLLLIGIVVFLVNFFKHVDCEDANFYVLSEKSQSEESIEFFDKTPNAKTWRWDFGDGSPTDKRQHVFHIYQKPGKYYITLTINGSCVHTKELVLTDKNSINSAEVPLIITSKIITVGQPTYFNSLKEDAKTWEWSFGENSGVDETDQNPVYTFSTPGEKTITLVVNGNFSSVAKKMIYVHPRVIKKLNPLNVTSYENEKTAEEFSLPRGVVQKDPLDEMLNYVPVAPKMTVKKDSIITDKKAPKISEDQFEMLLEKVAQGSKVKDDFSEFLCDNFEIPVVKNNTKLLTFAELCEDLKSKTIKIESLRLNKDKKTNCIKGLSINYKIKKYLIWVKD